MNKKDSGYILATVLALLFFTAALMMTMLMLTTQESKQSGNSVMMSTARELADAGQADIRALMANTVATVLRPILLPYESSFATSGSSALTTPVIPSSQYSSILSSLNAAFPASSGSLPTGAYTYQVVFNQIRPDSTSYTATSQVYYFDYTVTTTGSASSGGKRSIISQGLVKVALGRTGLNKYVWLADDAGSGSSGTNGFFDSSASFDGPVHVNSNLALSGKPTFKQGLEFGGSSVWMNSSCSSYSFVSVTGQQGTANGCTAPVTNGFGITYSTGTVPLPKNAVNQQVASLGLPLTTPTPLTPTVICPQIGLGTSCTSTTVIPSGTYLANNGSALTGGIYVNTSAAIGLSVDAAGRQIYKITTGSTITTITADYSANTTSIQVGTGTTKTYTGLPNGVLYVGGDVTALAGPSRTSTITFPQPNPATSVPAGIPPAIADKTALNIAASGGMTITGDLTYKTDPRTNTSSTSVLGLMTGTKSVMIGTAAPKDVFIQAAVLAGNTGTGLGVTSYSSVGYKGSTHLMGSLAEQQDLLRASTGSNGNISSGYADDFSFDPRFKDGGVSPPFFPTTPFDVQSSLPITRSWNEQ